MGRRDEHGEFPSITRREFVARVGSAALGTALVGCGSPDTGTTDLIDAGDTGSGSEGTVPLDLPHTAFLVEGMPPLAKNPPLPDRFHHPALEALLEMMSANGLPLYHSNAGSALAGPDGIVASDDVVVIKVNAQWKQLGGTNTDLLRGLLTRIAGHPDGFTGEIVVCDNRQDIYTGGFDEEPNSVRPEYTTDHVVSLFPEHSVGTWYWETIRENKVDPDGPWEDGYVVMDGGVSYPRFTTAKGTRVDLKNGVKGESGWEDRLRLFNVPVLKSHMMMGATATLKNFMGVLDAGNMTEEHMKGIHHALVYEGLMARMMKEVRMPDLNLLDASWVMHQPPYGPQGGVGTTYDEKGYRWIGALLAGLDPVAIDHAAVTEFLYPADVVTPCGEFHLLPGTLCIEDPPCLATGRCERMNPDLVDDRIINPSFAMEAMLGKAPVDALGRYLKSSSLVLHGDAEPGSAKYDLVRTKLS